MQNELRSIKRLLAIGVGLLGFQVGMSVWTGLLTFLRMCAAL